MSNKIKSEAKIQSEAFIWFNNNYTHLRGLLYHIPNGEKRDPITANKLKAMGVVEGVPDVCFHYRARTYFFEFKKNKNEKPSPAQEKIHKQLDQQRFIIWIVWDLVSFQELINNIINDESQQFTHGLSREAYFYRHNVFSYLYSLKDGEIIIIDKICEAENKQKFINCVSEFIVEGFDKIEGFEILFTEDFKAFYKKEIGSDKIINYEKGDTR